MRLSATFGVLVAMVCAGRADLGFGLVLPVFAAVLIFVVGDALRHAVHAATPARVLTR